MRAKTNVAVYQMYINEFIDAIDESTRVWLFQLLMHDGRVIFAHDNVIDKHWILIAHHKIVNIDLCSR